MDKELCSTIIIGLFQWKLMNQIETFQISGKSSPKANHPTMKDLSPYGRLENIHSMEFNFIPKKTATNGKSLLTDHTMPFMLNKKCQINSSKKQDNLQTDLLHSINIKNTVSTTIQSVPLLEIFQTSTDSIKRSQKVKEKSENQEKFHLI